MTSKSLLLTIEFAELQYRRSHSSAGLTTKLPTRVKAGFLILLFILLARFLQTSMKHFFSIYFSIRGTLVHSLVFRTTFNVFEAGFFSFSSTGSVIRCCTINAGIFLSHVNILRAFCLAPRAV